MATVWQKSQRYLFIVAINQDIDCKVKSQKPKQKQSVKVQDLAYTENQNILLLMKQIDFQHQKKVPYPFQQFGNLPQAAFKNRSMAENYPLLPQGEQVFIYKVGKKQFKKKHQSSIKQHWLGQIQDDSLSKQLVKHQYKVKGKSLQTHDIEGAQGGSLKSPAVKYKQKAQQLKKHRKIDSFDHYDQEQQEYKLKIYNAIRLNHSSDLEIGKLNSLKGHGHVLNPQKRQEKNQSKFLNNKNGSKITYNDQIRIKQKYNHFESKNEPYKQFFTELKNKEEKYEDFFNELKKNQSIRQKQNAKVYQNLKSQKFNTFQGYDTKQMPTPKITSRQHEYSLAGKSQTIEVNKQDKKKIKHQKNLIYMCKKQDVLEHSESPIYPKKYSETEFRQELHSLGKDVQSSRVYQNQLDKLQRLGSSMTSQQRFEVGEQKAKLEKEIWRKLNPTHLSHVIGSGSYNFGSDSIF